MEQNTNKERKSFREFIEDNKGKIIAGATIVVVGTVGYLVLKNNKNAKDIKKLGKIVNMHTDVQRDMVELAKLDFEIDKEFDREIQLAKDIAKEGALEEAIAAVKRKIQYRVGKIDNCMKTNTPESLLAKETYEKELVILKDKLRLFENEWDNMLH